jgi:hypothetical protein
VAKRWSGRRQTSTDVGDHALGRHQLEIDHRIVPATIDCGFAVFEVVLVKTTCRRRPAARRFGAARVRCHVGLPTEGVSAP